MDDDVMGGGLKKTKMDCYCIRCLAEKEISIASAIYNKELDEKKIEGNCSACGEYLCRIILSDIIEPSSSKGSTKS